VKDVGGGLQTKISETMFRVKRYVFGGNCIIRSLVVC
jgi:hypothetical protein